MNGILEDLCVALEIQLLVNTSLYHDQYNPRDDEPDFYQLHIAQSLRNQSDAPNSDGTKIVTSTHTQLSLRTRVDPFLVR